MIVNSLFHETFVSIQNINFNYYNIIVEIYYKGRFVCFCLFFYLKLFLIFIAKIKDFMKFLFCIMFAIFRFNEISYK